MSNPYSWPIFEVHSVGKSCMSEDLIPPLLQTLTMKLVWNKLSYETLAWVCLIQGFSQLFIKSPKLFK